MFLVEAIFTALMFALSAVFVVRVVQRRAAVALWEGSNEGARQRRALASWTRTEAEVLDVAHGDGPRIVEARWVSRVRDGRARVVYEERPRASVRLSLRIAAEEGAVDASDTITIPIDELTMLDVGKTIPVLHDPEDPKRFHVDTLRPSA